MSRVYARVLVALAGAAAVFWTWRRNQPVASRWPPGGWEPSTPPESPDVEPAPSEPEPSEPEPSEPAPSEPAPPLHEVVAEPELALDAVVQFANTADTDALEACGLKGAALGKILKERPFESWESMRATRGIGPKTLEYLEKGADV